MTKETKRIVTFLRNWTLPVAICLGIVLYLVYDNVPAWHSAGPFLDKSIAIVQPVLLFIMLFLSFCRVSPKDMKPRKWHVYLLLFQVIAFSVPGITLVFLPQSEWNILIEGLMLCFICPTATAAAVVTGKLGGDVPGIVTYTILINIVTAILVPAVVPVIHPEDGISFIKAFGLILAKVFPLLIAPCLLAFFVRYALPRCHRWLLQFDNLAFYIWGFSLMLAIAVTTKSIVHSTVPVFFEIMLGIISLFACIVQFITGKAIGRRFGATVTAGQSLGQKNTVFAIWMGYTFLTPVSSVAGGFYCIWHNIFNSYQLYQRRKEMPRA